MGPAGCGDRPRDGRRPVSDPLARGGRRPHSGRDPHVASAGLRTPGDAPRNPRRPTMPGRRGSAHAAGFRRRPAAAAHVREWCQQGVGLSPIRFSGGREHGRTTRFGRGGHPAQAVGQRHRRQRGLQPPRLSTRPVPRRRGRGRRGGAQRGCERRPAGGPVRLPEFRQPRKTRRDVAIPAGNRRDAGRVYGPRSRRSQRQRQFL